MKKKNVTILDTTIRDGSYAIDFQFTPLDTAFLSGILEEAGLDFIEIGHGLGLGANRRFKDSRFSDEEYLESAVDAVKKANIGMFFIPGIGKMEDIKRASRYKMDFVRVGTNINEFEKAKKFIELAKSKRMFVCANLMKSYLLSPRDFAEKVVQAKKYGADAVYLVDSAGGMLPQDIREYTKEALDANTGLGIGFHGHNNLGLANINTVEAFESGARFLDTSLRGIGRSAGNAATETIVAILKRKGIETGVDLGYVIKAAERYVQPLMKYVARDSSIETSLGYSSIHSSNLKKIINFARGVRRDPHEVILKLEGNRESEISDNTLKKLKKRLGPKAKSTLSNNVIMEYYKEAAMKDYIHCSPDSVKKMISHMGVLAKKLNAKKTVRLIVNTSLGKGLFLSYYSFHNDTIVCGTIEAGSAERMETLLKRITKEVDIILLDADNVTPSEIQRICDISRGCSFVTYSENELKRGFAALFVNKVLSEFGKDSILIYGPTRDLVSQIQRDCHTVKNIYLAGAEFESLWKIRNDVVGETGRGSSSNILPMAGKSQNLGLTFPLFISTTERIFTKEPHLLRSLQDNCYVLDYHNNIRLPEKIKSELKERNIKFVKRYPERALTAIAMDSVSLDNNSS